MQLGVRRLPVVDKLDHLVGIVSLDDLLLLLSRELENIAKAAHVEITPEGRKAAALRKATARSRK